MLSSRRVHRLRLSAPHPGLIQRGAFLFEDALRAAELPEADSGRLLLIRNLDIGTISARGGTRPLAGVLAEHVSQCASRAVHASDPAASRSVAVYFRDRAEAGSLLVRLLSTGGRADAWFWPLAVPDWQPELDRPASLRAALLGAVEVAEGAAVAARLTSELAVSGGLAPLLRALRPTDGGRLLRACGWTHGPRALDDSESSIDGRPGSLGFPAGLARNLRQALDSWSSEDPRTLWLACALLAGARPELVLDRCLVDRAERLVAQVERRPAAILKNTKTRPAHRSGDDPAADEPYEVQDGGDRDSALSDGEVGRPRPIRKPEERARRELGAEHGVEFDDAALPDRMPARQGPSAAGASSGAGDSIEVGSDSPDDAPPRAAVAQGRASEVAGLLFVLPVMQRLEIEGFLDTHPALAAWAIPARVARLLAQRLGVASDDPLVAELSPENPPGGPTDFDCTMPRSWQDGGTRPRQAEWRSLTAAGGLADPTREPDRGVLLDASRRLPLALRGGRLPDDLDLVVGAWLTAARRWCRRCAGLGLHDLARRSGTVLATPTHIDVILHHRLADVRVRRAGLDQDPGWLPWFGRIVQFHYQGEDALDG